MISPAIAPDSFTWSRVRAIIRLMLPRLKTLILVSVLMGVLSTFFIWLSSKLIFGMALMSIIVLIPAITFYVSPAFFGSVINSPQFGQLPATKGEKLTAMLIILLSLGLVTYYLPQGLTTLLMAEKHCLSGLDTVTISYMYHTLGPVFMMLSYIGASLPALVCLYCITAYPGHRWRAAVLGIMVIFIQGLVGGLSGGIYAFRMGLKAGLEGGDIPSPGAIYETLLTEMLPYMYIYVSLVVLCCGLFVWLTYRCLAGSRI